MMKVAVEGIRFTPDGGLQVKKRGLWRTQVCMSTSRRDGYMFCGEHCPLCSGVSKFTAGDGVYYKGIAVCQDRVLIPPREPDKTSNVEDKDA